VEYVISNSDFVEEAYSTGLARVHQDLFELLRVLRHLRHACTEVPPEPCPELVEGLTKGLVEGFLAGLLLIIG